MSQEQFLLIDYPFLVECSKVKCESYFASEESVSKFNFGCSIGNWSSYVMNRIPIEKYTHVILRQPNIFFRQTTDPTLFFRAIRYADAVYVRKINSDMCKKFDVFRDFEYDHDIKIFDKNLSKPLTTYEIYIRKRLNEDRSENFRISSEQVSPLNPIFIGKESQMILKSRFGNSQTQDPGYILGSKTSEAGIEPKVQEYDLGTEIWNSLTERSSVRPEKIKRKFSPLSFTEPHFHRHSGEIFPSEKYIEYFVEDVDFSFENGASMNEDLRQIFLDKIENEEFITSFISSIQKLCEYKKAVYQQEYISTQTLFSKLTKKIEFIKSQGISQSSIHERYPDYDLYAFHLVEIQYILEDLDKKCDDSTYSIENMKGDLKSIVFGKNGIDSLVGRDSLKHMLFEKLLAFGSSFESAVDVFHNIALLGDSGVGKTASAKVIAYVMSKSGMLLYDTVKIVSRADLIGTYVGQTAPRTKSILYECLESVLFIDEAYQLAFSPDRNEKDYGTESISEMVNFLDKYIGMSMVIVAGYTELMKKNFFEANEGLERRFPQRIELERYSVEELTLILLKFIHYKISIPHDIISIIYNCIFSSFSLKEDPFPRSAGDMLNIGNEILKYAYIYGWKEDIIKSIFLNYLKILT
jgi:hypothetical protein